MSNFAGAAVSSVLGLARKVFFLTFFAFEAESLLTARTVVRRSWRWGEEGAGNVALAGVSSRNDRWLWASCSAAAAAAACCCWCRLCSGLRRWCRYLLMYG